MKYYLIKQTEWTSDDCGNAVIDNDTIFTCNEYDEYAKLVSGKNYSVELHSIDDTANYVGNILTFSINEITSEKYLEYEEIIAKYNNLLKSL